MYALYLQKRLTRAFLVLLLSFLGSLVCVGCACLSISLIESGKGLDETVISGKGKDKILLMDISGVLSTKEKRGVVPFRAEGSIVSRVKEEMKKAAEDEKIKGLILRINSPGGTVTSSDIIYREVIRLREDKNIPVVACIMELAASGGYYVAVAADTIIAHPTSVTGSIGVVAIKFNAQGLLEKIGIENETIKAGDKKDMWSPFRPQTEEEKGILQNMLNGFHERFINIVATGRKDLSLEEVRALADGRVFNAEQALKEKLIDDVGYLDDAIDQVKKIQGIEEARVVMYHRPYSYKNNIYSRATGGQLTTINLVNFDLGRLADDMELKFMYLWLP